jgi:hypothetical protein
VVFLVSVSISRGAEEHIYTLTERSKLSASGDIVFMVRFPKGRAFYEEAKDRKDYGVRGVLAVCIWSPDPEAVEKYLKPKGKLSGLVDFADRHNLALISWTNPKGYKIGVSGDEMELSKYRKEQRVYDRRAKQWRNGYRRFCKKYGLPEENLLAYGLSGGGQTLHRLAMRFPEYFNAIHIHVNSSYDLVEEQGKSILWLVTTGTREYGYPAGMRFYDSAREKGFQMIFWAEENLGHADSPATQRLSLAFFKYCLPFLPDAQDPDWGGVPEERFALMKYPAYIGDHINGEAFKADVAAEYMDKDVMVPLPTEEIAKAWGTILNLE